MSVAIIDYGSGNLHSAAKAFERAARTMDDPEKIIVTRDPDVVFRADRVVLPGVGAFADCRRGLDALDGMVEALTEVVRDKARPFFGICVGMQLMATRGKEHVTTDGLNWIAGDVEKISPRDESLKIPHMGWNTLDLVQDHPVLERLPLGPKGRHAYFVHSYHLNAANEADVLARADYGGPVTAIVGKDTNNVNMGSNIFLSYTTRPYDYGHKTTQGDKFKLLQSDIRFTYYVVPQMNLRLELGYIQRGEKDGLGYELQSPYFYLGLRSSLWNFYRDY